MYKRKSIPLDRAIAEYRAGKDPKEFEPMLRARVFEAALADLEEKFNLALDGDRYGLKIFNNEDYSSLMTIMTWA